MRQKKKKKLTPGMNVCISWCVNLGSFLKNVHHEVVLVHMWSKDEPKSLLF